MKSSQAWTSSTGFKGSLGLFGSSVSDSITDKINDMVDDEYQKEITFENTIEVQSIFDDVMIVRQITYYVTEIPVQIGKKPSGHILIIQPMEMDSNLLRVDSGSHLYRNASHKIGDIRTYPFTPPKDISYSMYSVSGVVTTGVSFTQSVTTEVMTGHEKALTREQSTDVDTNVDINIPFEIGEVSGSLGFSYDHSDSYTKSSTNTSSTQISELVEIQLYIPGYDPQSGEKALQYVINPFIYWDNSGLLHVSWSVSLPKNDWNNYINKPDPALLLPYDSEPFEGYTVKKVVFELYTTPRTVTKSGLSVLINVIIHNYSYRPALDVTVTFYWVKPNVLPPNLKHEKKWNIIGNQTIPAIGGFNEKAAFISWFPSCKSAAIIVKITSSEEDFDETNNIGYSVWPQDSNNPFKAISYIENSGVSLNSKYHHSYHILYKCKYINRSPTLR